MHEHFWLICTKCRGVWACDCVAFRKKSFFRCDDCKSKKKKSKKPKRKKSRSKEKKSESGFDYVDLTSQRRWEYESLYEGMPDMFENMVTVPLRWTQGRDQ